MNNSSKFDEFFKNVNYDPMGIVKIPVGVILYRANRVLEELPTAHLCPDTGKTGTYFSANDPFLSETMCSEYWTDMIIGIYEVVQPIRAIIGKNTIHEEDVSHVDSEIDAIFATKTPTKPYAELFITQKQIHKIKFVDSYNFTLKESIEKWGYHDWRKK